MRAYVAVTDQDWFDHLSAMDGVDEVNFWTPHPWRGQFGVLSRGDPLLFKLKTPNRVIAGGGFFEHYSELPLSIAWDTFREKNGVASLHSLRERIARLRHEPLAPWVDDDIGCILLVEPFFFRPEDWIPEPTDWSKNIVRGKGYDLTRGIGRELWEQVVLRLQDARVREPVAAAIPGGYGDPIEQSRRVGQGTFRAVIMDLYDRQCAITRERALPTLDAAHIRPFAQEPANYVQNGMLLRSDLHRLFDSGYVTVAPEYKVEVSRRLRDDFDDGKNYEAFHGKRVWVPESPTLRPAGEILRWHNDNVFRG